MSKGTRAEHNLVKKLHSAGFAVVRSPSSGSGTDRPLPDALAGRDGDFHAIECKYSSENTIYLTDDEVSALEYFARNFGAQPLLAIRYAVRRGDPPWGVDGDDGWRFFETDDDTLYETDSGNTRVKKERAYANGATFEQTFGLPIAADGGTNNGPEDSDDEYDLRPCPLCEKEVKSIPPHLRYRCHETGGQR